MRVYASFDGKSIDIRYSYSFGFEMLPIPQRQAVTERITWNQERKAFQIVVSSIEQKEFVGFLVQAGDEFRGEGNLSIEKSAENRLHRKWPLMPIGVGSSSRLSFSGKQTSAEDSRQHVK
jgi:hypothetical protein